jgi:hypothetical protein
VRRQPVTQRQRAADRRWELGQMRLARTHPVTLALWTSSAPTRSTITSITTPQIDGTIVVREGL